MTEGVMATGPRETNAAVTEAQSRRWLFGPAELDERSLELKVAGEVCALERKSLEVLLHLLNHAGEVVTRDELLEGVWPGRILTDSSVTSCVAKLRTALRDDDQQIIRTAHGYGYRLVAPVKVEELAAPPPPRFDYKAGDHPPLRPNWALVERLGSGGHGEVWLARHTKTREERVFKFALDAMALTSLKREITIYRLLHDALGDRPDFVRIAEWNLEEPPYFLESECAGHDLVAWAAARGGLGAVPLEQRLDIAACIAEALAAAHAVGVLHKDLKPSNVLIDERPGQPLRVSLSDFGSGGVLDPRRLEALGITRIGFTRTIAGTTSGTPIYFAPEVMAGQPFTVQADVYALGVILYQLAVADMRKPLAPGWEHAVEDEILRDDIAASAAGEPARRLSDAGQLALRLRSLAERRQQRDAAREERARIQREQQALERLRARRRWLIAVTASLGLGVLVSTSLAAYAFYVKNRAVQYALAAKAVGDFMNEELLGGIRWTDQSTVAAYRQLLAEASSKIATRFAHQPDIAAQVHAVFAMRHLDGGQMDLALQHAEQARAAVEKAFGSDNEQAVFLVGFIGYIHERLGNFEISLPIYREALRDFTRRYGPDHLFALSVRWHIGSCDLARGDHSAALREFRSLLDAARHTATLGPVDGIRFKMYWALDSSLDISLNEFFVAQTQDVLASALMHAGELDEAEALMRSVVERTNRLLGPEHFLTEGARMRLARVLALAGRHDEAEAMLMQTVDPDTGLPTFHHAQEAQPPWFLGQVRLEQGRTSEAVALLERALALCGSDQGCGKHRRMEITELLAQAYRRAAQPARALGLSRAVLEYRTAILGAEHPWTVPARVALAETYSELGQPAKASEMLGTITPGMLATLPRQTPALHRYRRLQALATGAVAVTQERLHEASR